jgi:hypothetical protein
MKGFASMNWATAGRLLECYLPIHEASEEEKGEHRVLSKIPSPDIGDPGNWRNPSGLVMVTRAPASGEGAASSASWIEAENRLVVPSILFEKW